MESSDTKLALLYESGDSWAGGAKYISAGAIGEFVVGPLFCSKSIYGPIVNMQMASDRKVTITSHGWEAQNFPCK